MAENPLDRTTFDPRFWRWFPQIFLLAERRFRTQVRLLGLAVLVGIVAGLGAIVFYLATRIVEQYALGNIVGYHPAIRPGRRGGTAVAGRLAYAVSALAAAGGSHAGRPAQRLARVHLRPGSGRPRHRRVIDAYHRKQGQIRPRVPLVKIVASALTIGTGGSGGREGPIAQIGAGFGSFLANLLRLSAGRSPRADGGRHGGGHRRHLPRPAGRRLFAAEVLYRSPEFEPEVIMPAAIASVVSYCTFGSIRGWEPLFAMPDLSFNNPLAAGAVPAAGAVDGRAGGDLHAHVLRRDAPVPPAARAPHFRPAIGAFLTGVLALILYYPAGRNESMLAVLAFGYGSIQNAMTDGARRQRRHAARHRPGQDPHDEPDHRQRRLGRRVRAFDGHRRLRRRGPGRAAAPVLARPGAATRRAL